MNTEIYICLGGGPHCLEGGSGVFELSSTSLNYDDIENIDICGTNHNTRYWSMKKLAWFPVHNQPKLPTNFSMLSGCGLAIERSKALLIGGHQIIKKWQNDIPGFPNTYPPNEIPDIPNTYAPNDQVLMYDFVRQSWTWIRSIPFHSIWPLELKCSVVFNKSFKT